MRSSPFTAVLALTILAGAALAQSPPATNVPAPPPTITAPAVVPGAPVAALSARDAGFIAAQLESNMAVVLVAQRGALEHSQNPNVRGFAQKMITDHNYAQSTLEPIASMHHIQPPMTLSDRHREMLDRLGQLSGPAFDREYVNSMVNEHDLEIFAFNTELPVVVDGHRIDSDCDPRPRRSACAGSAS